MLVDTGPVHIRLTGSYQFLQNLPRSRYRAELVAELVAARVMKLRASSLAFHCMLRILLVWPCFPSSLFE